MKGIGVWGFKGKEDHSQKDGKSKCLANICFWGHEETMGHRKEVGQRGPANFHLSHHTSSILFVVLSGASCLPKPGPLCEFLEAVKRVV